MRNPWNLAVAIGILLLTIFSIAVVWPGYPKMYLPNFIDYPEGPILDVGRDAMRLGLDLKGGTYILKEADLSTLPPGTDVDQVMESTRDVIERRVNQFGVSETEVTREGVNRLAAQLPGVDADSAENLLRTARLEFREPVRDDQGSVICIGSDGSEFTTAANQLTEGTNAQGSTELQCVGTGGVSGLVKFQPAVATDSNGNVRQLTGSFIRPNGASDEFRPGSGYIVLMELTPEGGNLFEQITGNLVGYRLGIFLDDELIAAPGVNQAITGQSAVIEGLEREEASELADLLNAGALPVRLRTIQASEVEATLGEVTLIRGVQAGMIGVLAVMAFMILYYRLPGVLASLALLTYISVTMAFFKLGPITGPVTITLAGIAGFVLSIGMAVDANVLVFERMKEELRSGRSLASAVEHGFDRAWSSIRDSNVSTLITCLILWWFGDQFGASLVRGFALTLGIGVLISMFSAIVVTRTFLRLLVGTPVAQKLWLFAPDLDPEKGAQQPGAAKRRFSLDFVDRRWLYFALSAAILVPGIISLIVPPALKPGIEFTSGATLTLDFEANVSKGQVEDALAGLGHDEARVQRTSSGTYIIRLDELGGATGPPVGPQPPSDADDLEAGLEEALGPFKVTNFNQVSEIVSKEIASQAAVAIAFAALAILVYISWSFRNVPKAYRYGIAAVVAALHDGIFVLGAFSIFGKVFGTEIDSMFITGLLTVIGFSVHDTIVVFDRIREKVTLYPDVAFDEVVNASLTETVARSINTSLTVVFTLSSMLLLGPNSINGLLLTLLMGIIAGTYSSIFIASQILVAWEDGDFARIFRRIIPRRQEPAEVAA